MKSILVPSCQLHFVEDDFVLKVERSSDNKDWTELTLEEPALTSVLVSFPNSELDNVIKMLQMYKAQYEVMDQKQ